MLMRNPPTCVLRRKSRGALGWLITIFLETIHLCATLQWARQSVYGAQWPVLELARPVLLPHVTVSR